MSHHTILHIAVLLSALLLARGPAHAQVSNLGAPPVLNFSKKDFRAGTQIWDIAQDSRGVMWFGNNEGLLEFDGRHWRLHPLGNGTIVRSVATGSNGRVYAGGQGDFGYFEPDDRGALRYRSLAPLLPESERHFGDVWDVSARPEGVFFRTDNQAFHYHDGRLTALFPGGKALFFMGEWQGRLMIQGAGGTFYVFEHNRMQALAAPAAFTLGKISTILPYHPDTLLITTIQNGIFYWAGNTFGPWHTSNDRFLIDNRIFCAVLLPGGKIALGTSLNGLVTLDRKRRIFQHLNKKSGLQNNTVLSLFAPAGGGVWLGLDNGIDFVDLNSPFTALFPDGDLQGTGYAAQVFNGKIYFGTNTGLYATDWQDYYTPEQRQRFAPVQNTGGQVWSLGELDGRLLMGHHEGAFEVNGLTAHPLTKLQGIWRFQPCSADEALAGHYNGLARFKKTPAGWMFDARLAGLNESSRLLARDKWGDVWMAHPYRGIYRIRALPGTDSVQADFFSSRQGLPSDMGNHLFQVGENVVFAAEKGIFDFDRGRQRFVPNEKFNRIFGENTRVKYLRQDERGNIWYLTGREAGLLRVEDDALEKRVRNIPIPELTDKLTGGMPFILPVDEHNVFVAAEQGFIHFNPAAYSSADSTLRLVWHEIRLKKDRDSLLFGGHGALATSKPELGSRQNALTFSFAATDYPGGEFIRYAHYLEGAEREWSEWNATPEVTFNNLPPGDYTFHVKARNPHGVESAALTYSFKILPPWYAGRAAYFFYTLLLLGLVAGVIYRQSVRFEREKQDLQTQHQRREEQHQIQARRSEEAINRLQQEKLEAEIQHKTQELASATMHLVQKNEILNAIRERLEKLAQKTAAPADLGKEVAQIIKVMEQDSSIDADWEHFSQNFDQVHSDFLKRLGEQYAHLSPNDFKLCAYLRMNLSSKEIAALMNISVRGVEASRYRLRKRLGLDTETNLTEFLMRF